MVPRADIEGNKYDLSINRYKRVVRVAQVHEDPRVILGRIRAIESDILVSLDELDGMLR
jgi:type I restriction enzyme M protein